eukprot:CAMPEP_0197417936 /NCGR_PEP_ID=MMETSP1170-20131217/3826_1 /TAXON_ID=54406 /ORGANISM="Sarcinochrysis sp, Strain CCMP770" /LENGTH=53 /DNA_ID=CAMNT_0042944941 /DNA_START=681 /DNA_END=838 /DNA_ORIENTATION=+
MGAGWAPSAGAVGAQRFENGSTRSTTRRGAAPSKAFDRGPTFHKRAFFEVSRT